MFLLDFLVALGVALLLTVIIAALFGTTGPWPYAWLAFLLILLVAWAAGTWARPVGPPLWGVYWMPFLVFGLIVALVIAAATPPDRARRRSAEVPASAGGAAPRRRHPKRPPSPSAWACGSCSSCFWSRSSWATPCDTPCCVAA